MKIALLTDGIWPLDIGGMQKHSYYLAKYLCASEVSVYVFFPASERAIERLYDSFTEEERQYLHLYPVPPATKWRFPGHYLLENYQYSKSLYASFVQLPAPDLVYIQGFAGWYLLNAFGKKPESPPTIINFHGLNMFQRPSSRRNQIEQYLFRPAVKANLQKADYCQSLGGQLTTILQEQCRIPSNRILEIGIGISKDWLAPPLKTSTEGVRRIIFIGRYDQVKGLDLIYAVLPAILAAYPVQVDFIGPIPEAHQWQHPSVTYYGQLQQPAKIKQLLQRADLLLCPSYSEGMPTVILEAMACSCAVIATDVGAVRKLVDAHNGRLIPPGNQPALQEAIQQLLGLPEKDLNRLKVHSRQRLAEHFLWDQIIARTLTTFEEVIHSKTAIS